MMSCSHILLNEKVNNGKRLEIGLYLIGLRVPYLETRMALKTATYLGQLLQRSTGECFECLGSHDSRGGIGEGIGGYRTLWTVRAVDYKEARSVLETIDAWFGVDVAKAQEVQARQQPKRLRSKLKH